MSRKRIIFKQLEKKGKKENKFKLWIFANVHKMSIQYMDIFSKLSNSSSSIGQTTLQLGQIKTTLTNQVKQEITNKRLESGSANVTEEGTFTNTNFCWR